MALRRFGALRFPFGIRRKQKDPDPLPVTENFGRKTGRIQVLVPLYVLYDSMYIVLKTVEEEGQIRLQ